MIKNFDGQKVWDKKWASPEHGCIHWYNYVWGGQLSGAISKDYAGC